MTFRPVAMSMTTLTIAALAFAGLGAGSAFAAPTPETSASASPTAPAATPTPNDAVPTPTAAPSSTPAVSTPASSNLPPAAPLAEVAESAAPVAAERPNGAGAVMGQAGAQAPSSAARPLAAARGTEPSVNDQPAGTEGRPLGLDVSGWQQNVNWTAVKNKGARFAYVKTSEGPWTLNDYFSQQYNGAANAGLLRGGYHFARPNVSSGASQARVMLASGGGWTADGKTLPPALDIEDNPYVASDGTNKCYGMTPAALVSWAKDFTNTIKSSTGKDAVIYSSYYFWQECLGGSNAFANSNPLWIAAYYASSPWMPGQWPAYTFWQYADNYADASQSIPATFPGDQNVFNGTMDQLRTLAGIKTVVPKPEAPKPPAATPAVVGLIPGATVLSGKWAGDGKSYVGWYKDGRWCLEMPANPRNTVKCFYFGDTGDKPVVGDWDGNGTATVGVVRGDTWLLNNNLNKLSVDLIQTFGVASDVPIAGDWNGDGKATPGSFRRGSWFVTNAQTRWPGVDVQSYFGNSTDTPLVGDWNGDGKHSLGVWRNKMFYLSNDVARPLATTSIEYGIATDTPTTGDWDGDGRTSVGIVRDSAWHLTNNLATLKVDSVRN